MKLVASMIVRNERDRYLEPCVAHLLEFCDEIRVVDDASTDGSFGVLTSSDRIHVLLNDRTVFYEHEGAARQLLLRWTLKAEPSFVLAIDADEFVADGPALRRELEGSRADLARRLCMQEVWKVDDDGISFRMDGGWRPHSAPLVWPVLPSSSSWSIPNRQLASGRVPTEVGRLRSVDAGVCILHFGWACEADRRARHQRYVEADDGKFHAGSHLDSIVWPDDRVTFCRDAWPAQLEPYRPELVARSNRGG